MAPPPPVRSRRGLFVGIVSAVALLVVAAIAVGVIFVGVNVLKRTTHAAGPVDASTVLTSTSGKTVFSDDFRDPRSGLCATLADQRTVRLILFAATHKLVDVTDSATALADTGWQADLMVTSSAIHESRVTATHFEVRDLQR